MSTVDVLRLYVITIPVLIISVWMIIIYKLYNLQRGRVRKM